MQSRDFCFWLQGFFELRDVGAQDGANAFICGEQIEIIKEHLALVFEELGRPAMSKVAPFSLNLNDESHRIC